MDKALDKLRVELTDGSLKVESELELESELESGLELAFFRLICAETPKEWVMVLLKSSAE